MVTVFLQQKRQSLFDVKQEHTIYRRKSTKHLAKFSTTHNHYSFRIINHSSTTTARTTTTHAHNNNNNTVQHETTQDSISQHTISLRLLFAHIPLALALCLFSHLFIDLSSSSSLPSLSAVLISAFGVSEFFVIVII